MTPRRGRFTVFGETPVDLITSDDHDLPAQHLGGSPANVAVGLARLAQPACLITQIGSDHLGQFAHSRLSADARACDPGRTGRPDKHSTGHPR